MGNISRRAALVAVTAGLALTAGAAPALAGTVKYDLNGPAGVVHEHTEKGNVTVEEIGVEFDGLGALTGWNTKRDGTGKAYSAGEGVSGDVTLFAQYADGTMLAADLTEIGGKTYYYAGGEAQTGFIAVSGLGGHDSAIAYFDPADGGAMVKAEAGEGTTWLEAGGKSYLADEDGALVGTVSPAEDGEAIKVYSASTRYKDTSGKYYLFASDGSQKTGLVELDGKKFLFIGAEEGAHAGSMVTGRLVDASAAGVGVAGANTYPTEDGLATGIVYISSDGQTAKYWFGADGVSSAGWHKTEASGKACWVYTGLDGRVTAVNDSDPEKPTVDREHIGGAKSVEGIEALAALDDAHAAKLGEAVKSYMASTAPEVEFTVAVADGSTNEKAGVTVSFSPVAGTTRRDTLSLVWGESGQAYGLKVEKTETETAKPAPDEDKDDKEDDKKDDQDTDKDDAKIDRGHLGGATSVENASALDALSDEQVTELDSAVRRLFAELGGDAHMLAIESGTTAEKIVVTVDGSARYSFELVAETGRYGYVAADKDSSDQETNKGDKDGSQNSGESSGTDASVAEHEDTADDGTNVTPADEQASTGTGGDLPQTGVPAVAAALVAGGTAAAAIAGGKLAWDRRGAGTAEDDEE